VPQRQALASAALMTITNHIAIVRSVEYTRATDVVDGCITSNDQLEPIRSIG
jgi:hypothetical protein